MSGQDALDRGDAMDVFDLSIDALDRMERVDLANAEEEPSSPIGHFDFHGCVCGVASFTGRPPWEWHDDDELLHVLAGESELTIRKGAAEETRTLRAGDLALVPRGCWHRNNAREGVTMLFMTPREGGRHAWNDPALK